MFSDLTKKIVGDFWADSVEGRSLKLCMIITLLKVKQIMPDVMNFTLFQGHRYVRIINFIKRCIDSCQFH